MTPIEMILIVAACFVAAVLNLAIDSRFRRRLTRFALVTAGIIGSVFYGYGYGWILGLSIPSVIRALMALCRMFGGINDLASIQAAPIFQLPAALSVFWLGHFLAFYVMASATITALGERLLRQLRVRMLRRGPLLVIYGINARSVGYGRRMAREKHRSVVFIDQEYNASFENSIKSFGAIIDSGTDALAGNLRFLQKMNMKPGSRRLELAALHTDSLKNLNYARALLDSMTARGITPEQTSLLAAGLGHEAAALQALGEAGYGSVFAFDDYELQARLMFRAHPPCDQIAFDSLGRATEDFHAVILGFGHMGRAVLNHLILSGQFEGSHFQADIFDSAAQNGFLHNHPLTKHYDIVFHSMNSTTDAFYSFLEEQGQQLSMIILCTGSREKNHEIAEDLAAWFPLSQPMPLVLQATRDGWFRMNADRSEAEGTRLEDTLDVDALDAMAMQLNQVYCQERGDTHTAPENWRKCDYFSRQSSRACADFYPAVLRATGKTAEEVLAGAWPPQEDMLENLARTEHLRWCAFHYVAGFSPMPESVWQDRAEQYRKNAASGFRISRDGQNRLQACLIPWEELDTLSQRENAVTGGSVDYKQMDRNNVLMLSRILAAQRDAAKDV